MSAAAAGCIEAAARVLAADPGAVGRALARHRAADDRCVACGAAWPCVVAAIAHRARDVHEVR